jgi:peptide chain release factor
MEYMIQITSGRGPEECARVVARIHGILLEEARACGLFAETVETIAGPMNGTLLSAMILIKGENPELFLNGWNGTVQWISKSPYRKYNKRKNWFVGVSVFDVAKEFIWDEKEVVYETLRASGPGGQHVNKTESAVRAKHLSSGVSVVVSERRSQHQNKTEAKERLQDKVKQWYVKKAMIKVQNQWQNHNTLKRGESIRTFEEPL